MKTFYINLDRDVKRREHMEGQLRELDIPFERVQGVYGVGLTPEEKSEFYSSSKSLWRYSMELPPAHIGCSLSQISVYRRIVEEDLPYALVLEDDVVMPLEIRDVVNDLEKLIDPEKAEVLLLSPAQGVSAKEYNQRTVGAHRVLKYKDGFYASSYLITKRAAMALLLELYPVGDVADCWPRMNQYKVVDLLVLDPPLILQDQETFGSSTNESCNESHSRGLRAKLLYKMRRLRCVVRDAVWGAYRRRFRPYNGV